MCACDSVTNVLDQRNDSRFFHIMLYFTTIKLNELLALRIFSELSIPQQFQLLTFREVLLKHFNNTLTFFHNN